MPLKQGSDNGTIGENIARLIDEGKPQDQAVAIALSEAGRSNKSARIRRAFDAFIAKDWGTSSGAQADSGPIPATGLQDYNLGPGQKKRKMRKKGQTAKTVFEQFPRDYVVRDKNTGIADVVKGGSGSGNFGHSGRPGEQGGSGEGGGSGTKDPQPKWKADIIGAQQRAKDAESRFQEHNYNMQKKYGTSSTAYQNKGEEKIYNTRIKARDKAFNDLTTHVEKLTGHSFQSVRAGDLLNRPPHELVQMGTPLDKGTGIADVLKYTADQVRDKGKFIPGSADVRHRSGSYRRGILPGMHYHGNQPHTHQGGDISHGHKPGAV